MNRRVFLQSGSAALSVAATFGTSHPGRAAVTAPRPAEAPRIPVGFLGIAYSHAAEKLRLLQNSTSFQLVGAWPETDALAKRLEAQTIPVLTRDQVLERCEVVVVETDVPSHARFAALALEANRHVHLEKPPATTLAEFDTVLRLARERRRLLQVGYMWRHHPGLRAMFEAVREGWLGEVYLVRATLNNTLAPDRRAEWAGFPGGVLFELGSHLIDAIVRLLGRPDRVTSFLKTHGHPTDRLADNNVAVFEYAKATALITSATLQPNASAHRAFEILGTRGTAVLRPLEPPTLTLDLADAAGPYAKGRQEVPMPAYRRYEGEFAELAHALTTQTPLPISLEQERDVQETLLRACGVG
ncbi:MAG: Gfo/Idh/MocA family oxidoreductase [Verrucomicrobiales bacterium]|nr:Gfo/Idh/MocA family oxidoreductase [Verrucomicrobiales bacterium]